MVKKISLEFKQQSVDYLLTNAHLSISELANHPGVGKSTPLKWVRQLAPNKTSRRELTLEQQPIIALEKENKALKMANEILNFGEDQTKPFVFQLNIDLKNGISLLKLRLKFRIND